MGHWSENLVEELAELVGGDADREQLKDLLAQVGREIDVLSGRTYHPVRRTTSVLATQRSRAASSSPSDLRSVS